MAFSTELVMPAGGGGGGQTQILFEPTGLDVPGYLGGELAVPGSVIVEADGITSLTATMTYPADMTRIALALMVNGAVVARSPVDTGSTSTVTVATVDVQAGDEVTAKIEYTQTAARRVNTVFITVTGLGVPGVGITRSGGPVSLDRNVENILDSVTVSSSGIATGTLRASSPSTWQVAFILRLNGNALAEIGEEVRTGEHVFPIPVFALEVGDVLEVVASATAFSAGARSLSTWELRLA